jgi:hypothetical protein
MSPFIGHPQDISADALELLDRALSCIWRDELLKARAKDADQPAEPALAVPASRQLRRSPASR